MNKQNQAWMKRFTIGCFVALTLLEPYWMLGHAAIMPDLRISDISKQPVEDTNPKRSLKAGRATFLEDASNIENITQKEAKDSTFPNIEPKEEAKDSTFPDTESTEEAKDSIKPMGIPDLQMPAIDAKHVYAIDTISGRVLFEKNATINVSIASTTKIMTALVALEMGDLQKKFLVSDAAQRVGGSTMGLRKGGEWTLEELLYGLLLRSGNDAAVVIAEGIGGSLENFAKKMNEKAIQLGLKNSHFVTPHGLDAQNQYATAEDLAILTKAALNNPIFRKIVETKKATLRNREYYNTNPLLNAYPGVDGVKTGYTDSAGRCLVVSAKKNGLNLIVVILNSPSSRSRVADARKILDTVFGSVQLYHFQTKGDEITEVAVKNGKKDTVRIQAKEDLSLALTEAEQKGIKIRTKIPEIIYAPIQEGDIVGTQIYEIPDQPTVKISLVATESVLKKTYVDYFVEIVKEFLEEFLLLREKVA